MSLLERFRQGAEKAGIQATTFIKEGSSKAASESRGFVQGFSLPGESEKAAKILESFLGEIHLNSAWSIVYNRWPIVTTADPNHPESALNSIPKAVLQHARGIHLHSVLAIHYFLCRSTQASPFSKLLKPASSSLANLALELSLPVSRMVRGLRHHVLLPAVLAGASRSARISPILSSY